MHYFMLITTRKVGDTICIGDDIKIRVLESRDGTTKRPGLKRYTAVDLGIEHPKHLKLQFLRADEEPRPL